MGRKQRGFTYALVLSVVAVTAIGTGITSIVTSTYIQRDLEEELIFRGMEYRNAIKRFYEAGSLSRYPRSLDELLRDPRFPYKVHLRRPYSDPMAAAAGNANGDWVTIENERGEIMGVASKSMKKPIKKSGFPNGLEITQGGSAYRHWQFIFVPQPKRYLSVGANTL